MLHNSSEPAEGPNADSWPTEMLQILHKRQTQSGQASQAETISPEQMVDDDELCVQKQP